MNEPIALLHGFAGHADSWSLVAGALGGRDVRSWKVYGHDFDHPARSATTFEEEVARIVAWLRGFGPVRLCGYSMGGRLALGVLRDAPELIASLVLVGANPGLPTEAERAERRTADAKWSAMLRERGVAVFAAAWQEQGLFASQARFPAALEAQRSLRLRHDAESLALAMECLGLGSMPSYWDTLAAATTPITLVVGGLDAKFKDLALRMQRSIAGGGARLVEVADVGHNVVLEAPAELAAEIGRN